MARASVHFRPVIFLDTNALHYMSSYLRWAEKENLPPYSGDKTYEEVEKSLKQHLPESIVDWLCKGAATLAFLQRQVEHDTVIYTSRFAKAEVIYGILEGQAHANMARGGVSYRMRQRTSVLSELVSMYLKREDYESVISEWESFLDYLKSGGRIEVLYAESKEDFSDIAEIAEFIQSRIFMDVVDSWMYACTLVVRADKIVTFDGYFKNVIKKLRNPHGDPKWQHLKEELCEKLKEWFPGEPSLPELQSLKKGELPQAW